LYLALTYVCRLYQFLLRTFFCTIEFLCMKVEQNIHIVNILLTCADNRNDDKTSTFMDRGPSNHGRGPVLTACLLGLRSHSRLHRGCCLTRMGPKYVGSLVCTESLRMYVGYTNSFSIRFLSIPTICTYCTY
jgi:hypothetical protein